MLEEKVLELLVEPNVLLYTIYYTILDYSLTYIYICICIYVIYTFLYTHKNVLEFQPFLSMCTFRVW